MAKQNTRTADEQQQGSRGAQMARRSPGGSLINRGRGQSGLGLSPFEVFLTNPFSLMRRMTDEMDRAFAEFNGSNADISMWTPPVEVYQQDGQYVVRADLAGLRPDDVRVEVTDGALVIEGERIDEREQDRGRVHRTEIRYGRFSRVIPLPDEAKVDEARARFENGVLEVDIPVQQQQENRRQIQVEGGAGTQGAGTEGAGTQGSASQPAGTQTSGSQGTGSPGAGTQGSSGPGRAA